MANDDTDTSQEVVDTSTDEEDLEDIEVSPEDLIDEPEESEGEEPKDEEADTEPQETEEESEDDEQVSNNEAAARRIQEKRDRDSKVKQDQVDYLSQAEDERDLVVKQLQVDAYNNRIEINRDKLTNSYEKALNSFDILRDESPEIKAAVDEAIDAFQAMNVTIDSYGNPLEVRGDLYKYLQTKADSIKNLAGLGARNQINSKTKEKSKVLTPPGKPPKESKEDPDLKAFDEEAYGQS